MYKVNSLTLSFLSSFLSEPPEPPFLSCCSLSRCFLDLRFFFLALGSGAGFSSGSDSESESLELQNNQISYNYASEYKTTKYHIIIQVTTKQPNII